MPEGPSWCVQVEKSVVCVGAWKSPGGVAPVLAFAELAAGARGKRLLAFPVLGQCCAWGKQRLRQQVQSSILLQTCFVKVKVSMLD